MKIISYLQIKKDRFLNKFRVYFVDSNNLVYGDISFFTRKEAIKYISENNPEWIIK